MSWQITQEGSANVVVLDGEMGIQDAANFHQAVLPLAGGDRAVPSCRSLGRGGCPGQEHRAESGPLYYGLNMPNMDGIQLIRQLRAVTQYRFTPMVLLTTESHQEKKMEGKAAGATGWIVKPFEMPQLLAVVKKVCP
jgi:DNA-binding NarL/FixJ family response regulator